MCKGRNTKSIDILEKKLNLTKDFIVLCLKKLDANNLRYRRCFISLYETCVMDVDPFIAIDNYSNYCYMDKDISEFNLEEKSYKIFKSIDFGKANRKFVKQDQAFTEYLKSTQH